MPTSHTNVVKLFMYGQMVFNSRFIIIIKHNILQIIWRISKKLKVKLVQNVYTLMYGYVLVSVNFNGYNYPWWVTSELLFKRYLVVDVSNLT